MSTLRRLSTVAFLAAALFGPVTTAGANAVPVGATTPIIAAFVLGTDVAYDSINHVYLVVATGGQIGVPVFGRFVAANGTPLGNVFAIQTTPSGAHFPGVAFSPDANGGAGGFLVAWSEGDLPGQNTSVHARMVAFGQNGAYGPENLVDAYPTYWNTPVKMAYSTTSKEFLLVFTGVPGGRGIRAVGVDNNAAVMVPTFSVAVNSQFEDWPSVAYNPTNDQFLVSYVGYNAVARAAFTASRLVTAGGNPVVGLPTILYATVGTWVSETVYNPRTNQFLVAWVGGITAPTTTFGRVLNADASIAGNVNVLSNRFASVDGMDLDYNPVTDTYFLVASTPISGEDGGVELKGATGVPVDNGFLATAGAGKSGRPYPRIKASTQDPNWLICMSNSFGTTDIQLITGTPASKPQLAVDTPTNNANVPAGGFIVNANVSGSDFLVSGWAADLGAASLTGVDGVVIWAFPTNGGSPIFAGWASYGWSRPDVGAAFGAQFTNSGYGLTVSNLPPGGYVLEVSAHSTVNNSWNTPVVVIVNVTTPYLMSIDTPGPNATVPSAAVHVGGWAADLTAPSGSADAIHVWAFPTDGSAPPTFVGSTTTFSARPDVAAAFNSFNLPNTGYDVFGPLTPGPYTLVVYMHSSVANAFVASRAVTITVTQ
jgi:hypothetical protein